MIKSKFIRVLAILMMCTGLVGCAAQVSEKQASVEQTTSKQETRIEKYNVALISNFDGLPTLSCNTIEVREMQEDGYPTGVRTKLKENVVYETVMGDYGCTYGYAISDWSYEDNGTVILYLTDGKIIQTSSENVLLYYDPNY